MWVRRVCCSDVGMEGVAVVVDGEGFVGCVRGLRDALAGLPVVVGLLPSSRAAHGVVARGYDVFGQGAFELVDRAHLASLPRRRRMTPGSTMWQPPHSGHLRIVLPSGRRPSAIRASTGVA